MASQRDFFAPNDCRFKTGKIIKASKKTLIITIEICVRGIPFFKNVMSPVSL
jgi:hypothetical protein